MGSNPSFATSSKSLPLTGAEVSQLDEDMDGLDVKRGPEGLDREMMPTRLNHRMFFTHFHSFIIFHSLETRAQIFHLKLVLHLLLRINGAEAYACPAQPDRYSFFPEAETCPGNTSPVSRSQAECLKY